MNQSKHIKAYLYCTILLILLSLFLIQALRSKHQSEAPIERPPTGRTTVTRWLGEQKEDFIFAEEKLETLKSSIRLSIQFFKVDPPESYIFVPDRSIVVDDDETIQSFVTSLKKVKGIRATVTDRRAPPTQTAGLGFYNNKGTELLSLVLTATGDTTDAVWQFQGDPLYPIEEIYLLSGEWGSFQKWEETLEGLKKN